MQSVRNGLAYYLPQLRPGDRLITIQCFGACQKNLLIHAYEGSGRTIHTLDGQAFFKACD